MMPPNEPPARISAEEAIASRRSIRAFRPDPVPDALIRRILDIAARAPSGSNIQPWQVQVLTGEPLALLVREMTERARAGEKGQAEYAYYPRIWREPYLARRRKVGWDLYGALGIGRRDLDKIALQHARNFTFFDAPVGLIFTIDRDMEQGSWLDYGMFLQNIMIAARACGLDTCPQAAFIWHADLIARRLALPPERMLVCGMALGYADLDAPENGFSTERAPLADFVRFVDHLA